jgi:hypothetical protein
MFGLENNNSWYGSIVQSDPAFSVMQSSATASIGSQKTASTLDHNSATSSQHTHPAYVTVRPTTKNEILGRGGVPKPKVTKAPGGGDHNQTGRYTTTTTTKDGKACKIISKAASHVSVPDEVQTICEKSEEGGARRRY